MPKKLTESQKKVLKKLEPELRQACQSADLASAKKAISLIQEAFINDRDHFRILRAKNWYFEALLDAGNTEAAARGFDTIQLRARENTRIYLEAMTFLCICFLRLGRIDSAKQTFRVVIPKISNIKSDAKRQQYEKRLTERIEDECILGQLIGQARGDFVFEDIHKQTIEMVQKPEHEILESIGNCVSIHTQTLLSDMTDYSIKLLPSSDQKLLCAVKEKIPNIELGQKVLAALKRIGWRTFCDESSEVHKLWKDGVPKVFNDGYFTKAIITTLVCWKIGIPGLAVGISATAIKYGCQEFCKEFKPKGLMIPQHDKR